MFQGEEIMTGQNLDALIYLEMTHQFKCTVKGGNIGAQTAHGVFPLLQFGDAVMQGNCVGGEQILASCGVHQSSLQPEGMTGQRNEADTRAQFIFALYNLPSGGLTGPRGNHAGVEGLIGGVEFRPGD